MNDIKEKLKTLNSLTWCPGCNNFFILESVKRALARLIKEGARQEDFAMVTGIGCHAKIFDYLNISGFYGLHGRALPTALGIKLGNPNLTVLGFAGDGDTFAEGMDHFIHSFRYNADMTLIVFNNKCFSLTTGQPAPTSQIGFKSKANPEGEYIKPINSIKLALASGATFVARVGSRDLNFISEIIEKAIKHKGFSYIEAMQECIIFSDKMKKSDLFYKVEDNHDLKKAAELADEWDYGNEQGRIPLGVLYQTSEETFEEKSPQLKKLKDKKIGWAGLDK